MPPNSNEGQYLQGITWEEARPFMGAFIDRMSAELDAAENGFASARESRKELARKIAALENSDARRVGLAAGAGAVASALIGGLAWLGSILFS